MTARDFVYWLQGFFELNFAGGVTGPLSSAQADCIREHIGLVLRAETETAKMIREVAAPLRPAPALPDDEARKYWASSKPPPEVICAAQEHHLCAADPERIFSSMSLGSC